MGDSDTLRCPECEQVRPIREFFEPASTQRHRCVSCREQLYNLNTKVWSKA